MDYFVGDVISFENKTNLLCLYLNWNLCKMLNNWWSNPTEVHVQLWKNTKKNH